MKKTVFLVLFLLPLTGLLAQDEDDRQGEDFVFIDPNGKKGFMFGVNVGYFLPNDDPALFYDGRPKGNGFINLASYLQIDRIKTEVLQALGNAVDYGESDVYFPDAGFVKYNNTISLGGNLRYQFNWYNAIVADVNFASLVTDNVFTIGYQDDNGTSQDVFQSFPIQGKEDRLMLSLGYQLALAEPGSASMNFEFGPELTSLKVKSNTFTVGSRTYNILRAQTIGNTTQVLNSRIPTLSYIGAYGQLGGNIELDKFTIDLAWRTAFQKIDLNPSIEAKRRLNHTAMVRLVYRVTVKGF